MISDYIYRIHLDAPTPLHANDTNAFKLLIGVPRKDKHLEVDYHHIHKLQDKANTLPHPHILSKLPPANLIGKATTTDIRLVVCKLMIFDPF